MMDKKLVGLAPIISEAPKVLILGSMPSSLSLQSQEYYGNPRNHFWAILFEMFSQKPIEDYQGRIRFIKRNHIILWDAIGCCYREGSLDSNITMEEPNDITGLLKKHPTIRAIGCNGTKSFQIVKRYGNLSKQFDINVIKLPSTSPIPGKYTKSFSEKVKAWSQIMHYLDEG